MIDFNMSVKQIKEKIKPEYMSNTTPSFDTRTISEMKGGAHVEENFIRDLLYLKRKHEEEWKEERRKRWKEKERKRMNKIKPVIVEIKTPKQAFKYIKYIDETEDSDLLNLIALSPEWSYRYATDMCVGRFLLGEKVILKSPMYSTYYAEDVFKGRWPEAEDIISTDAHWSFYYAFNIVGERWEKGEEAISKSDDYSYRYSFYVLKERFILGEDAIRDGDLKIYKNYIEAHNLEIL